MQLNIPQESGIAQDGREVMSGRDSGDEWTPSTSAPNTKSLLGRNTEDEVSQRVIQLKQG